MQQALAASHARIQALEQQGLQQPVQHQYPVPPNVPLYAHPPPDPNAFRPPSQKGPKPKAPSEFHGQREKLQEFRTSLSIYFSLSSNHFPDDNKKIMFAGSYLRGMASTWFQALLTRYSTNSDLPELNDYKVFDDLLQNQFGDLDRLDKARSRLLTMKQIKSASEFASRFQLEAAELDWPDSVLVSIFLQNLKPHVNQEIRAREPELPKTLQDAMRIAIRVDNLLFDRDKSNRQARPSQPTSYQQPRPQPSYLPLAGTTPMDLDAVSVASRNTSRPGSSSRSTPAPSSVSPFSSVSQASATGQRHGRGKLTPQEREHRNRNNLCMYCGNPGHRVPDCPSKNRQQASATSQPTAVPKDTEPPASVSLVPAETFAATINHPDAVVTGTLSLCATSEISTVTLPPELKEFRPLFESQSAKNLPAHQPWDHTIPLQEGKQPPYGPIYSLSETELAVLRDYISDNLENGFIRPSTSPAGAPILFVKKKDGSLRLCVDYRGLNAITIKNRYALPLIPELLDRLQGAQVFSKLDLRGAYNLVRIAKGEEWKTAFRTRYGHYEYQVMPFGLTNAPASFQGLLNDVLRPFLDLFAVVYLDDILIFSKTRAEHTEHLHRVLDALRKHSLFVKLEKCSFYQSSVSFLGYVISDSGISMDPSKTNAITSWPVPTNSTQLMSFLGLANFYRRFIKNFSHIASPLTALLKKEAKERAFEWPESASNAFAELKEKLTTAPVLAHFHPELPIIAETDASDKAIGACLLQNIDNAIHPVAFYSRKLTPAETNYEIHDKELLAIVACFKEWRVYLEGARHQITVLCDHKNLGYFTTSKALNRRQARWSEQLGSIDFSIIFQPGKLNTKADLLSRRADYAADPKESAPALLGPTRITMMATDEANDADPYSMDPPSIEEMITLQSQDKHANGILTELANDTPANYTKDYSKDDGLLLFGGKIYTPAKARLRIMTHFHDPEVSGHHGLAKTLDLIQRQYYWPGIRSAVESFILTCQTCARNKTPRHKPHGLLQQLPVPERPWSSVSMDFIVKFPASSGYDSVFVVVDRLTKMAHFIPCNESMTSEDLAQLFLDKIFRLHGLPDSIISDRGSVFTSAFTQSLCRLLGIKHLKSTAYHPQTDGQTERVNQILEQYLRIYVNYQQDDWVNLLPLAEFAYNNAKHSSTDCSPFYANFGFHPGCHPSDIISVTSPKAADRAAFLKSLHKILALEIRHAHSDQARYYDPHHLHQPAYDVGSLVWLRTNNLSTTRPTKKLDYKRIGPFKVKKKINNVTYELNLPDDLKIHPTFHISLLDPFSGETDPRPAPPPAPPIQLQPEHEGLTTERTISHISDSRQIQFKIEYLTHFNDRNPDNPVWIPASELSAVPDLTAQYHQQHPRKPRPDRIQRGRQPRLHRIENLDPNHVPTDRALPCQQIEAHPEFHR